MQWALWAYDLQTALEQQTQNESFLVAYPGAENEVLCSAFLNHNKHPGQVPEGRGSVTFFMHQDWNIVHWEADDQTIMKGMADAARSTLPETDDRLSAVSVAGPRRCCTVAPGLMNS